jgi:hypothetical protein
MPPIARLLILAGLALLALGLLLWLVPGLSWLGRLPGDIRIERGNLRVYLPITTSLLLSAALARALALLAFAKGASVASMQTGHASASSRWAHAVTSSPTWRWRAGSMPPATTPRSGGAHVSELHRGPRGRVRELRHRRPAGRCSPPEGQALFESTAIPSRWSAGCAAC